MTLLNSIYLYAWDSGLCKNFREDTCSQWESTVAITCDLNLWIYFGSFRGSAASISMILNKLLTSVYVYLHTYETKLIKSNSCFSKQKQDSKMYVLKQMLVNMLLLSIYKFIL